MKNFIRFTDANGYEAAVYIPNITRIRDFNAYTRVYTSDGESLQVDNIRIDELLKLIEEASS